MQSRWRSVITSVGVMAYRSAPTVMQKSPEGRVYQGRPDGLHVRTATLIVMQKPPEGRIHQRGRDGIQGRTVSPIVMQSHSRNVTTSVGVMVYGSALLRPL